MQRFFVPPEILTSDPIVLPNAIAGQLSRVLRLSAGAHIVLLDDSGWAHEAALVQVTPERATARIVARSQPKTEPRLRLTLCQALVTEQKMDWILQKGTELGVSAFQPLVTQRSLPARAGEGKLARWRRIVTEAAEQSGRVRLPTLAAPCELADYLPPPGDVLALIGWLDDEAESLGRILSGLQPPPAEVVLFIGPEGGFAPEEVALARAAGVQAVSLGPRVLRTETAGMAAAAALMFALGE